MQPFHSTALVFLLPLFLVACGGDSAGDAALESDTTLAVNPDVAMDTTPAGTPAPPSSATIQAEEQGEITARLSEWEVALSRDTVPAGEVTFHVMNAGSMEHALEVEGQGIEEETAHIPAGETASLTVSLQPGTYEVYCPVVGEYDHQEQGMRTSLVVR